MSNWVDDFYGMNPDAVKTEVVKKKKKETTLPLHLELSAMDSRNFDFYKNLSPEQKKEISMWVLMRYMSSSQNNSEHHLMMVNDLVNHSFGSLSKHPELQWKLLALCGTGRKQHHSWIAPPRGVKKNKLEQAILDYNPLLRNDELEMLMRINTQDDFRKFFEEMGHSDKSINELLK